MSALSIGSTSASTYLLIYEEPTSYTELFLLHNPECREQVETNELLKKTLEEACLEPKKYKERGYQALCAYFDKPLPGTERIVFDNGMTLVHFAALGGQESCLKEGDSCDIRGASVVHYLAMGGHKELLSQISEDQLFRLDEGGLSVAEHAFLHKRVGVVEWLAKERDCQIAYFMKDIYSGSHKENECFYTPVGVHILKLIASEVIYENIFDSTGVSFLFSYIYSILEALLSHQPGRGIKELYEDFSRRTEGDWEIHNAGEVLLQRLDRTIRLLGNGYLEEEVDFDTKAVFILDRGLGNRRLEQSRYEPVVENNGTGSGVIYEVQDRKTKVSYAAKMSGSFFNPAQIRENEWHNYLRAVDRENKEHLARKASFVFFCCRPTLIMTKYEANLQQVMESSWNLLSFEELKKITKQILGALAFLHDKGVVLGNLTPKHVFFSYPFRFVIGDLTSAYREGFLPKELLPPNELQRREYRSPEHFLHALEYYGCKSDMWSLGCIVFELFNQRVLFPFKEERIMRKQQEYFGPYPNGLLERSRRKFVNCIDAVEPPLRMEVLDTLHYNRVKKRSRVKEEENRAYLCDFLIQTLQLDPSDRISSRQALEHPFYNIDL